MCTWSDMEAVVTSNKKWGDNEPPDYYDSCKICRLQWEILQISRQTLLPHFTFSVRVLKIMCIVEKKSRYHLKLEKKCNMGFKNAHLIWIAPKEAVRLCSEKSEIEIWSSFHAFPLEREKLQALTFKVLSHR